MPVFTDDTQEAVEELLGNLIGCRLLVYAGMAVFLVVCAAFAMGGPVSGLFVVGLLVVGAVLWIVNWWQETYPKLPAPPDAPSTPNPRVRGQSPDVRGEDGSVDALLWAEQPLVCFACGSRTVRLWTCPVRAFWGLLVPLSLGGMSNMVRPGKEGASRRTCGGLCPAAGTRWSRVYCWSLRALDIGGDGVQV